MKNFVNSEVEELSVAVNLSVPVLILEKADSILTEIKRHYPENISIKAECGHQHIRFQFGGNDEGGCVLSLRNR